MDMVSFPTIDKCSSASIAEERSPTKSLIVKPLWALIMTFSALSNLKSLPPAKTNSSKLRVTVFMFFVWKSPVDFLEFTFMVSVISN